MQNHNQRQYDQLSRRMRHHQCRFTNSKTPPQHRHKKIWGGAFGKEVGHLAQGLPSIVEGTNTFKFHIQK